MEEIHTAAAALDSVCRNQPRVSPARRAIGSVPPTANLVDAAQGIAAMATHLAMLDPNSSTAIDLPETAAIEENLRPKELGGGARQKDEEPPSDRQPPPAPHVDKDGSPLTPQYAPTTAFASPSPILARPERLFAPVSPNSQRVREQFQILRRDLRDSGVL